MIFSREKEGIFYRDKNGKELAKITYVYINETTIDVNHTVVDESLRGQGIAKKLVDELAAFARENSLKVKAICSYVVSLFEKDSSYDDIKL